MSIIITTMNTSMNIIMNMSMNTSITTMSITATSMRIITAACGTSAR